MNNHLTIFEALKLLTLNPARIFKLKSGTIKIKQDADLTVFDLNKSWKVDPNKFFSKSKNTPFDGILVEGKNIMTFVRGRLVFSN